MYETNKQTNRKVAYKKFMKQLNLEEQCGCVFFCLKNNIANDIVSILAGHEHECW